MPWNVVAKIEGVDRTYLWRYSDNNILFKRKHGRQTWLLSEHPSVKMILQLERDDVSGIRRIFVGDDKERLKTRRCNACNKVFPLGSNAQCPFCVRSELRDIERRDALRAKRKRSDINFKAKAIEEKKKYIDRVSKLKSQHVQELQKLHESVKRLKTELKNSLQKNEIIAKKLLQCKKDSANQRQYYQDQYNDLKQSYVMISNNNKNMLERIDKSNHLMEKLMMSHIATLTGLIQCPNVTVQTGHNDILKLLQNDILLTISRMATWQAAQNCLPHQRSLLVRDYPGTLYNSVNNILPSGKYSLRQLALKLGITEVMLEYFSYSLMMKTPNQANLRNMQSLTTPNMRKLQQGAEKEGFSLESLKPLCVVSFIKNAVKRGQEEGNALENIDKVIMMTEFEILNNGDGRNFNNENNIFDVMDGAGSIGVGGFSITLKSIVDQYIWSSSDMLEKILTNAD